VLAAHRSAVRFPHEKRAGAFLISTEKTKAPRRAPMFLPVDILRDNWNRFEEFILQAHFMIRGDDNGLEMVK
jgi:hypothetical protein